MKETKPLEIDKRLVFDAYLKVCKNKGAAGVDGIEVKEYQEQYKDNLYKLWNRMSSGCYFPKAVKLVEIPKPTGGKRPLGIPTVEDRIAQMTAVMFIAPDLDPCFHKDSYAYRPNKSAHAALAKTRGRCFKYHWVLDMDISKFFDTIDHELLMKAVEKHVRDKWVLLYIKRWLTVPYQTSDGNLIQRTMGVPQGSVIGPVLANLFLHYVFDKWMDMYHPEIPFERYADDTICHCRSEHECRKLLESVKARFAQCLLKLNEDKTKIVYTKSRGKKSTKWETSFDFLGYTFRDRAALDKESKETFTGFLPAISKSSQKRISVAIKGLCLKKLLHKSISDIANLMEDMIKGWIQYYTKFGKTEFKKVMYRLNMTITYWLRRKHKPLRGKSIYATYRVLVYIAKREPNLFYHWRKGYSPA